MVPASYSSSLDEISIEEQKDEQLDSDLGELQVAPPPDVAAQLEQQQVQDALVNTHAAAGE